MLTPKDLKQIAQIVSEQLEPIKDRLDGIDERLDVLEENSEITRTASNKR